MPQPRSPFKLIKDRRLLWNSTEHRLQRNLWLVKDSHDQTVVWPRKLKRDVVALFTALYPGEKLQ